MAKGKGKKGSNAPKNTPIITDPRFSSVHSDPRFKAPNLNSLKVKIDDRFTKDKLEGVKDHKTKYDRYGRLLTEEKEDKTFERLFKQEKEESESGSGSESESESANSSDSEVEKKSLKIGSEEESQSDSESDSESESEEETKIVDRARGGVVGSDEESSSDSDSDSSDEELESDEESEIELEEEKPEEGDPERRFAVVNLDWDNVTSVDLFAAFTSFLPQKGEIKNISIFPSQYGKEKMQQEDLEGPPKDLFQSKKQLRKQEESDDESDSDISDMEAAAKKLYEEGDGEKDYDSKALRRYQLQRLRYYYAVVTCDSIRTAKAIYDNCDGTEFESSANIFDLRYIPDDMEFDDEPRDSCDKIPANYKPNNFVTDALQSSKAKLTWDETPTERMKMATKAFSQREIEDMDFKAYLASDSEEEDGEELKNKYKDLAKSSSSIFETAPDKEDEGVDMEITFTPGLTDGSKKQEEEKVIEETTISAYKRKEKERRKKRLEKFKQAQKESKPQEDNDNTEDAQKTKGHKKNGKDLEAEDSKKNAELELLTMGTEQVNHFNMRDVIKAEKEKSRKKQSKKLSKKIDREMVQDDFKADLSDPRFKDIFEKHEFAIDPTLPNFKKTDVMKQILQERQKRRNDADEAPQPKKKKNKNSGDDSQKSGSDLSNLVKRVKSKK